MPKHTPVIPAAGDIQTATANYATFRRSKSKYRLEDGTWYEEHNNGPHLACALGAFLLADNSEKARMRGCAADMMPDWLVNSTPNFFDFENYKTKNFHIKWSDALYLPGGLVDRANALDRVTRKQVYEDARIEILRRYRCAFQNAELVYGGAIDRDEALEGLSSDHTGWFGEMLDYAYVVRNSSVFAEQLAGTIIQVLDEKLTELGV